MSLETDPFIIEVKARLEDEIKRTAEWVANGSASTIEEYRKQTGKIVGFRAAVVIIDECIQNYMHDKEEE